MNVGIPFNRWSRERIRTGRKRATSRYKKLAKAGDMFVVDGVEYEIDLVVKLPLWFITKELYVSEGAESEEELVKVWLEIHPRRGFRAYDEVWYHHFKIKK